MELLQQEPYYFGSGAMPRCAEIYQMYNYLTIYSIYISCSQLPLKSPPQLAPHSCTTIILRAPRMQQKSHPTWHSMQLTSCNIKARSEERRVGKKRKERGW